MDKEAALKVISDGHTVYTLETVAQVCEEFGIPPYPHEPWRWNSLEGAFEKYGMTWVTKSGEGEGVWSLYLSYYVAEMLGAESDAQQYFGRGAQAKANARAVARVLGIGSKSDSALDRPKRVNSSVQKDSGPDTARDDPFKGLRPTRHIGTLQLLQVRLEVYASEHAVDTDIIDYSLRIAGFPHTNGQVQLDKPAAIPSGVAVDVLPNAGPTGRVSDVWRPDRSDLVDEVKMALHEWLRTHVVRG